MSSIVDTSAGPHYEIQLEERMRCALCGSAERAVHRAFRDIPVVRCSKCGFMYSARMMSAETMDAYYRENFGSQRHLQGQMVNARVNGAALSRLLDLKSVRSWLDIGTGYGFLLKWLKEKWEIAAQGIELSAQERGYANEKLGLQVHDKILSQAALPKAGFDVVSCFEVIEHIPEPRDFVKEMAEYIRPGGSLVVMTDNFESNAARTLKGGFPKWIPHTHVSHFGPESLRYCLNSVASLRLEREASYTPWDVVGRQCVSVLRPTAPDEQAYDLRAALSTEMQRDFKLFQLRYFLNPLWTGINLSSSLDGGALMYAVCRKHA